MPRGGAKLARFSQDQALHRGSQNHLAPYRRCGVGSAVITSTCRISSRECHFFLMIRKAPCDPRWRSEGAHSAVAEALWEDRVFLLACGVDWRQSSMSLVSLPVIVHSSIMCPGSHPFLAPSSFINRWTHRWRTRRSQQQSIIIMLELVAISSYRDRFLPITNEQTTDLRNQEANE